MNDRRKSDRGRRKLLRRALGVGAGALLLLVFLAAMALGAVLHAGLPLSRRIVADVLERTLSDLFLGEIEIEQIEALGPGAVRARGLVAIDPEGQEVIRIRELRARGSVPDVLQALLFGGKTVVISHVRADGVECRVLAEPGMNAPSIARTFSLARRGTGQRGTGERRTLRFWFESVEVGSAWCRIALPDVPTFEADARRVHGRMLVTERGVTIDVDRFGALVRGLTGAETRVTGDFHLRAPGKLWGNLEGYMGEVGFSAFAYLRKSELELRLDVPRARPEDMRALLKEWPLREPAALHLTAKGELPILDTKASAEIGPAKVEAAGPLRLEGDVGLRLDLAANHFDLRSLTPEAPASDLSASARLVLSMSKERVLMSLNGMLTPSTIEGVPVPAMDVNATLDRGRLEGTATAHEKGMPLKVDFELEPSGELSVRARVGGFEIREVPRLARHTPASGFANVEIRGRLKDRDFDLDVDGKVDRFALDPVRVGSARLTGKIKGRTDQPEAASMNVRLSANQVLLERFPFQKVELTAEGPLLKPRVRARLLDPAGPSVVLSGTVSPGARRAEKVELSVSRGSAKLEGKLALLEVSGRALRVKGLELGGTSGALRGDLSYSPELVELTAEARELDLAALGQLAGVEEPLAGVVNVKADVVLSREARDPDRSRGRVWLALRNGALLGQSGVSFELDGELEDGQLRSASELTIPELGSVATKIDAELAGPALTSAAWLGATGSLDLHLRDVELNQLVPLLPSELGIGQIAGKAELRAEIGRRTAAVLPSVTASFATRGLMVERVVLPEQEGDELRTERVEGVELVLGVSANGETGYTLLTGSLEDASGTLAGGTLQTDVDLDALVERPEEAQDELWRTPVRATVRIPERRFNELPAVIRPAKVAGYISGRLALDGPLSDPVLSVNASVRDFSPSGALAPLDGSAALQYERRTGRFGVNAQIALPKRPDAPIAVLRIAGTAPFEDLTRPADPARPRWQGEADLAVYELPIGIVSGIGERDFEGTISSGSFMLRHSGPKIAFGGRASLRGLEVDDTPVGDGDFWIEGDREGLHGGLESKGKRGRLTGELAAGLVWADGLPSLDEGQPIEIDLVAKRYELAAIAPFVRAVLDDIEGEVDAELRVLLRAERAHATGSEAAAGDSEAPPAPALASGEAQAEPAVEPGEPQDASPALAAEATSAREQPLVRWVPVITGEGTLRNATLNVAGLGLELRDTSGRFSATEQRGLSAITIRGFESKVRSEVVNLRASGNFYLHGFEVERASASLSARDMPLPVDGVPLANVTGSALINIERQPTRTFVIVQTPELVADISRTRTKSAFGTEDNPQITILQPLRAEKRKRKLDALPWEFEFQLGRRVRVVQKSLDFEIPITGEPHLVLDGRARMIGEVILTPGGRVPVLGKVFRIESGRIGFDPEDVSNPMLNVTASWQAPAATVYLRVRGRFDKPELSLDSDPAYTEEQIWVLLSGGSLEEGRGAQQGAGAQAAWGAFKGLGMDQLLGGTPLSNVEVTPDTEQGETSYRASYRVSDRVRLEGIYAPGGGVSSARGTVDASGDAVGGAAGPGERRRDAFAGAVEYRFHPNWAVRTEAGSASAGVDLLWQYRY